MEKEQIPVEEKALRYVAKAGDGSMRDALSLLDQCAAFPNAAHDDMVDSMSQALSYLLYASGVAELPEPTEEERVVQGEVRAFLDSDTLFNPYGEDAGELISRQGG